MRAAITIEVFAAGTFSDELLGEALMTVNEMPTDGSSTTVRLPIAQKDSPQQNHGFVRARFQFAAEEGCDSHFKF